MSLLRPGIDSKHIIEQAMRAKTISYSRPDPWAMRKDESYSHYIQRIKEMKRQASVVNNKTDQTLIRLGSLVRYGKDGTKQIEKYNSRFIQIKLQNMKSDLSEADLLRGVNIIEGDCNLVGTTVEDLSCLRKIGGTLTIDTTSKLKDLSGLKEVLDDVLVHAKNESEAKEFLKLLGFNPATIKGKIVPIIKNYL